MVRRTLAVLALVPLLGFAAAVGAQTQKWDQAAVTAAASKLPPAIDGLREIIRGGPALQIQSKRRIIYQILDNLRLMEFSSQTLAAELKKGAGMEETVHTYNRLQQIRRDTEVLAQKVDISAVTRPKLEEAQSVLAQIEPFYPAQPQVEDLR